VAKPELGTKRIDPETGRKFYDLNKDPIVSPYTGKSYPRSYFDSGEATAIDDEEAEEKELDGEEDAVDVVSLEDADDEAQVGKDDADVDLDDDDVELGDDDDETFLEEEEDDDDVADIIDVDSDDEEQ
jgi:uncharacterized protein (TIGR02300 family)